MNAFVMFNGSQNSLNDIAAPGNFRVFPRGQQQCKTLPFYGGARLPRIFSRNLGSAPSEH